MKQPLSETLNSRTFLGLLLAQFTATFNDQAVHVVAIFYAVDMLVRFARVEAVDDKAVVAIVTACFITPFLLFSSYAGPLGDRFSKRSVVVFWKSAEVLMMGLALLGLGLPHLFGADSPALPTVAVWSASLVVAVVFLMGLHSTFFVPAKLGAMPEILHPAILSRGNGVLEGTSFTAQILGTSCGGILYSLLKGEIVAGKLVLGQEWMIGVLLFALALGGMASALLMRPIPAAAPHLQLSWNWWRPLRENLSILWKSQPLTLSVTGIAFCVFMTLFLRQTLFYQAELTKEVRATRAELAALSGDTPVESETVVDRMLLRVLPPRLEKASQEPELRVALLFAVVGLGVGTGSIVAGYVSGHRIELGLVPIGGIVIVVCTALPFLIRGAPGLFVCLLFGIGFGAGFYLVPLYTMLQHRAPKQAKGNVVSASNFLNVVGGIIAVCVFYSVTLAFEKAVAPAVAPHPTPAVAEGELRIHIAELEQQQQIPALLFGVTSLMTAGSLLFLVKRLPDFYLRAGIWIRSRGHNPLRTLGIENMPTSGPVILLADCGTFDAALNLVAAVDRYPRLIYVCDPGAPRTTLQKWAEHAGMISVPAVLENATIDDSAWSRAESEGVAALRAGRMVALTVPTAASRPQAERLLAAWRTACPRGVVLPVACDAAAPAAGTSSHAWPRVIIGEPLPLDAGLDGFGERIANLIAASEME